MGGIIDKAIPIMEQAGLISQVPNQGQAQQVSGPVGDIVSKLGGQFTAQPQVQPQAQQQVRPLGLLFNPDGSYPTDKPLPQTQAQTQPGRFKRPAGYENFLKQFMQKHAQRQQAARGGRMGYAAGGLGQQNWNVAQAMQPRSNNTSNFFSPQQPRGSMGGGGFNFGQRPNNPFSSQPRPSNHLINNQPRNNFNQPRNNPINPSPIIDTGFNVNPVSKFNNQQPVGQQPDNPMGGFIENTMWNPDGTPTIPLVRDYGDGNQLPPGSTGFSFPIAGVDPGYRGRAGYADGGSMNIEPVSFGQLLGGQAGANIGAPQNQQQPQQQNQQPNAFPLMGDSSGQNQQQNQQQYQQPNAFASYANFGTPGYANGGMLDLKGHEMDYRAKGGFVPIGKKERADDVPARLSKNEFVFTADAVRNAGGGNINKGAEKMYRLMKQLEGKF